MRYQFYHTEIDSLTSGKSIALFSEMIDGTQQNSIFFLNANNFVIASKNAKYKAILKKATLVLNDGIGLKIASLFTKVLLKENLNGTDLIPEFIEKAVAKKQRIYLLGGQQETIEQTYKNLLAKYPAIIICGFKNGYFSKEEELQIINEINQQKADILLVGMGTPKQEEWIAQNKELFPSVKICIGVGGFFDFVSETVKRAPVWMRKIGLEWLFRTIKEPNRLAKRYLVGIFEFGFCLIRFAILRK